MTFIGLALHNFCTSTDVEWLDRNIGSQCLSPFDDVDLHPYDYGVYNSYRTGYIVCRPCDEALIRLYFGIVTPSFLHMGA